MEYFSVGDGGRKNIYYLILLHYRVMQFTSEVIILEDDLPFFNLLYLWRYQYCELTSSCLSVSATADQKIARILNLSKYSAHRVLDQVECV